MATPRIISLALLVLSFGFAVWSWTMPELAQTHIIGIYMALAVVGPMLTLLDMGYPCSPQKWFHNAETIARLITIAALVLRLDDPNKWILLAMGGFYFLCILPDGPKEPSTVNHNGIAGKETGLHFGTIVVVSGLCIAWAHFRSIGTASLFSLTGLLFWLLWVGMLLGYLRRDRWHFFDQPLTQEQHRDIWPLLMEQYPNTFWKYMVEHQERHGGFAQALKGLPTPTLLAMFNRQADAIARSPQMEIMLKEAINAREPRAQLFWQVYNSKEAATLIGQLGDKTSCETLDTWDIPA